MSKPIVIALGEILWDMLPTGNRDSGGEYFALGRYGYYWSATGSGADYAWYYGFYGDDRQVNRYYDARSLGFACRCLKA